MSKELTSTTRLRKTDIQVIEAYYFDDDPLPLSPRQEQIKDILREIRSLELTDNYTAGEVINFLQREHNIAESSAWKYRSYCHRLFGKLGAVDKDFERLRWHKRGQSLWNEAHEKDEDGNFKMKDELRVKFIKESKEITNLVVGFDKDDSNAPEWDKIAPPPVLVLLSDSTKQFLSEIAKGGVVNWSDFVQAETITHEPTEK